MTLTEHPWKGAIPIEMHVADLAEYWGIPKRAVERYLIARQVEQMITNIEKEREEFSNAKKEVLKINPRASLIFNIFNYVMNITLKEVT